MPSCFSSSLWSSLLHMYTLVGASGLKQREKYLEPLPTLRDVTLTYCDVVTPYGGILPGSTLTQVLVWCLTAPSHHLKQRWLIIGDVLWHSPKCVFTRNAQDIYLWYEIKNCQFEDTGASPRLREIVCDNSIYRFTKNHTPLYQTICEWWICACIWQQYIKYHVKLIVAYWPHMAT